MPESSDGAKVSQADAERAWAPIARELLIQTARTYGSWITYQALSDRVQEATGITTGQLLPNWIGSLLDTVGKEADRLGEPHLTSLCVSKNQSIGEGYPWAPEGVSEREREEIAARDRLDCYRRYATDLPADEGVPTLTPEVKKRLARQRKSASVSLALTPNFWWVNQGVTSDLRGDFTFLWASQKDVSNRSQPHWDSLEDALVGDVVVHYARGYVIGTSVVAQVSRPTVRPPAFEIGERTGDMGREVLLQQFQLFDTPVALEEIPVHLRESELGAGTPFTQEGKVQRGYFFPIGQPLAVAVFDAAGLLVDLQSESVDPFVANDEAADVEMYLDLTGTDGVALVKYRREQGGLRSRLFGAHSAFACGICGRTYPVRYLRTAHIKSRSACSEQERKDWQNVVMAACVFGCDALFEDGMLRVDGAGVIRLEAGHDETRAFALFTGSLAGKRAPAFTPGNSKYFEWRNAQPSGGGISA